MRTRSIAHTSLIVCALLAMVACAPGCSSGPAEIAQQPAAREPAGATTVRAPLGAFELTLPERSEAEASALAAAVASVLTHQVFERPAFAPLEDALLRSPHGASSARLLSPPGIVIGHHRRLDAFWALDENVAHDFTTRTDVGVEAAAVQFERVVDELTTAGMVDGSKLDLAGARRTHVIEGAGSSNQSPIERVKEYVFYAPRLINGVTVARAGVRVSVHRSGKVASIRVEGPLVNATYDASGVAAPAGTGYGVSRLVEESDLDARVRAENPGAEIKSLGLLYWLPDGVRSAVVAPRQGYMVFPPVHLGGQSGSGRGHRVLYTIDDVIAAPLVAPLADPAAEGDPRP
jgi:hypothetical protein